MTGTAEVDHSFNAWTGAWLPLVQHDGSTVWASPVEVLCGEKDGVDLDFPRDDFRLYGRLLLSALVQALFAAKTKAELLTRLNEPLARSTVEAQLAPVLGDFDLFGKTPFLQVTPLSEVPDQGAATFVFTKEDLHPSRVEVDAISLPTALLVMFIEQAFASGGGRGYGTGPGREPGAFTMIDPGSIRRGGWANTLTQERVRGRYHPDSGRAWSKPMTDKPAGAIGLVRGLFFQPRAVWLIPAGAGRCSFGGQAGPLVRLSPLKAKSKVVGDETGALWVHPCAPMVTISTGLGALRLRSERPAWTGLAQLLAPIAGRKVKKVHPLQGPAEVLVQWRELKAGPSRLLVLDFERDKAIVRRRFFEAYPLAHHLADTPDAVERLRALIDDAEQARSALIQALTSAHDGRKHGGFALPDAESDFWQATESAFFDWLHTVVSGANDESDAAIDDARLKMEEALRRKALDIFESHIALSEFDARKQARVAMARRGLRRALYPRTSHPTSTATTKEVSS